MGIVDLPPAQVVFSFGSQNHNTETRAAPLRLVVVSLQKQMGSVYIELRKKWKASSHLQYASCPHRSRQWKEKRPSIHAPEPSIDRAFLRAVVNHPAANVSTELPLL